MTPPLPHHTVTTTDIRRCLDGAGPTILYQPLVHSESGLVIGAEAFSRFPSNAPVLDWFRCAEESGLGPELELRAVENILRSRALWPSSWKMVGVNLSPERLGDERMRDTLTSSAADGLVVELTDQNALPVAWDLQRQLDALRDGGVLIAVSGLKPGDAQFDRILRIQPEVVKLDARILDGIVSDPTRRRLVESLVAACHRTGVFVVAVGIETEGQQEFARNIGIDAAQGHLFGAPADVDAAGRDVQSVASLNPSH